MLGIGFLQVPYAGASSQTQRPRHSRFTLFPEGPNLGGSLRRGVFLAQGMLQFRRVRGNQQFKGGGEIQEHLNWCQIDLMGWNRS